MASDAPERLDHYLVRLGWARSRRAAREILDRGLVRVNGRVFRKGAIVGAGDNVEVADIPAGQALAPDPDVKLQILFRDPAIVVIDKPAPMACHPLRPGECGTVMNGIAAEFPDAADAGDNPREGGLIHRLDNGTSGALMVALDPRAFAAMRQAIRTGQIRRTYHALVEGNLKGSLKINSPIAHNRRNRRKMLSVTGDAAATQSGARTAFTMVEPVRRAGRFALVAVTPSTGMRHQIRVHLAEAGYPIAGDLLYGGPPLAPLAPQRFWLHLAELKFRSPASGPVRVASPLPKDLRQALKNAEDGR